MKHNAIEANPQVMVEVMVEIEAPRWKEVAPQWQYDAALVIKAALSQGVATGKVPLNAFEVSVLCCDDQRIRELNRLWRSKDTATNVLSFPMMDSHTLASLPAITGQFEASEHVAPVPLGDVAMDWSTIAREADDLGVEFCQHASHMLVHGMLHLIGYTHDTVNESTAMRLQESTILLALGCDDPWAQDTD